MTYVTLDAKFFVHVFVGFAITSLLLTAILIYEVNRVFEIRRKFRKTLVRPESVDDLWSNDPYLMEGVALMRGKRQEGSRGIVTLTQISYNDSCIGFLWSRFHLDNIVKYSVQVTSVSEPGQPPMEDFLGGTSTEYSRCGLSVSSSYLVNLTAHGPNPGSTETVFGIMWTTHQVPPTPSPIKVLQVTERTIHISLPEIVLTKGPLTSVEVRLIMRAKVLPPPTKDNPWSNVLSRERRSVPGRAPKDVALRAVELPFYLLALHMAQWENDLSEAERDLQYQHAASTRQNVNMTRSDFSQTGISTHYFKINPKNESVFFQVPEVSSNDVSPTKEHNFFSQNFTLEHYEESSGTGHSPDEAGIPETIHWLEGILEKLMGVQVPGSNISGLKSNSTWSNLTDGLTSSFLLSDWLEDDTVSSFDLVAFATGHQDAAEPSGMDMARLLIDPGPEINVSRLFVSPESRKMFAEALNDEFDYLVKVLKLALHSVEEEVSPADGGTLNSTGASTSDANGTLVANASVKSEHHTRSLDQAFSDIYVKIVGEDVSPTRTASGFFRGSNEMNNDTGGRGRRSSDYGNRKNPMKITEDRDQLMVDPYQSLELKAENGSEPVVLKRGLGFFITDHYGVRYPYFNNSRLGRLLLRMLRFQEADDFLTFGKPLLMNLTRLSEEDFGKVRRRLDKVMTSNRRRREELFLRMFEDYIWLQENNKEHLTRRSIPDAAKLGLPPGYTIAQFTDGQARNITLGSKEEYGGIPNPPLDKSTEYEIILAVMSTVADVTKHAWTSVNVTTLPEVPKIVSPIFAILSGAFLAICVFVLLLSCFVLWCSKRPRKPSYRDDQFDDVRLEVPPDFGSRPMSPLIVAPRNPEPALLSPYINAYPPYLSPPPYPILPPPQPPGYWGGPRPLPAQEVTEKSEEEEEDEGEDKRRATKRKKRRKKHRADSEEEREETADEANTLPNYIRKVHKPEAHWNRIYDPTSKRYLVDKRANVRGGGNLGADELNNMSDDDEGDPMKGLTFKDEFSLLTDGQNLSGNALGHFSRFPHIPLCDRTRVVLSPDSSSDNTTIHANYIDGCNGGGGGVSYIAAMSPFNDETVLDFWRMVFQQNIETIVMMTNVQEDGIVKCAEYWPQCSGTGSTLGHFLLQSVSQKTYADYVIRQIVLKSTTGVQRHEVTLFQYTAWQSKNVPKSPVTLLDMRYLVRRHHESKTTPILVHCGTGVSRTSVFIAVDALIDQYEQEGGVSVFNYVSSLRRARPMMVRCLDQYIFIYTALQDEYEAGDTNIELDDGIQNAMIRLSQINPNTGNSYLEDQFELLNFFTLDFLTDDVNIARMLDNRYTKTSRRGNSINPIFIDGLRNKDQFVLINSPYDDEITAFWHFVCQHNVVSIVQIGNVAEDHDSGSKKSDRQQSKFTGKYRAEIASGEHYDATFVGDILLEETTDVGKINNRKLRHFSVSRILDDRQQEYRHRRGGKRAKQEKHKKARYRERGKQHTETRGDYTSTESEENNQQIPLYCMDDRCGRRPPVKMKATTAQENFSGSSVGCVSGNDFSLPVYDHCGNERLAEQHQCFRDKIASSRIGDCDDPAFFVLKDGRLVKSCRNDNRVKRSRLASNHSHAASKHCNFSQRPHRHERPRHVRECKANYHQRKDQPCLPGSGMRRRRDRIVDSPSPVPRKRLLKEKRVPRAVLQRDALARPNLRDTGRRKLSTSKHSKRLRKSLSLIDTARDTRRRIQRRTRSKKLLDPHAKTTLPKPNKRVEFLDKLKGQYRNWSNSSYNNQKHYFQKFQKLKNLLHVKSTVKNDKPSKSSESPEGTVSLAVGASCQRNRDVSNSALVSVLPSEESSQAYPNTAAASNDYRISDFTAKISGNQATMKRKISTEVSKESKTCPVRRKHRTQQGLQIQKNAKRTLKAPSSAEESSTSTSGKSRGDHSAVAWQGGAQCAPSTSKDLNESATKKRRKLDTGKKGRAGRDYSESKALTPGQLLDLHELVWTWQCSPNSDTSRRPKRGPILIHCPAGSGDASLLCACALVCEQVQEEQEVDVYHMIKHLRRKCPSALGSFAEYDFLHRVLFLYVTEYMDEVAVTSRWKNRPRDEQVFKPVIGGNRVEILDNAEVFAPSSTPDNTTYNRASSSRSDCCPYFQDNLTLVDERVVSTNKLASENLTPPSLSPFNAIELSTHSKFIPVDMKLSRNLEPAFKNARHGKPELSVSVETRGGDNKDIDTSSSPSVKSVVHVEGNDADLLVEDI